MAAKKKDFKPKARSPRGFGDRLGAELAAERDMLAAISAVYERWGFDPLETPAFEYTDALGKFLPDSDRPNQGVFSLQDDDEQWMSLRYDLTAPLARFVAENYDGLAKPFRRYAVGSVWRNEKPGPGRFRQFTQCDADSVGAPAPGADVECCMMLAEALDAVGLKGEYVIRISDRRLLTGLLEMTGADAADEARRLTVLRALDKLDRLGPDGVRLLLGKGRKDESGDYTEGAGLDEAQIEQVMAFLGGDADDNAGTLKRLRSLFANFDEGHDCLKGVETLEAMAGQLAALGYDEDRIRIDLSVIRGLEYYTGPVFEAELTFEVEDEKGRPVRFGSVASGGRYDDLVKRFKGVEVPAVGISIGVSRLLAALALTNAAAPEAPGPVVVLVHDKARMADYQKMAAALRKGGVRAEVYLGGSNVAKQLKYADRRRAPLAIIQGSDEKAAGEVTIKDLVKGAALSKEIEDNAEWRESQRAQISVPTEKLVEEVLKLLGG